MAWSGARCATTTGAASTSASPRPGGAVMPRPCLPSARCWLPHSVLARPGEDRPPGREAIAVTGYLDYSGRDDVLGGGARRIAVDTPKGTYQVWVKRIGNNPRLRVLLLHGGPGSTHEYLEACDSFLPAAGIEYYYYDQLGSGFSDQPEEPSLGARQVRGRGRAGPPGAGPGRR